MGSATPKNRVRVRASKGDPVFRDLLEKDPGVRKPRRSIKFGWCLAQGRVFSGRRMCNLLLVMSSY